eukprot:Gb_36434 [translate_table: standard]
MVVTSLGALHPTKSSHFNKISLLVKTFIHKTATIYANTFNTVKSPANNSFCTVSAERGILSKNGRLKEGVGMFDEINHRGISVYPDTYSRLLQTCANKKFLPEGKQLHAHILVNGFEDDNILKTKLVILYAYCGSFVDARHVFDKIPMRNVFCWNAMIRGYVMHGYSEEALAFYYQMQREGMQPDDFTFPSAIRACTGLAALEQGKGIHVRAIRNGFETDVYVGNALIVMYSTCGNIESARQVFDKMSQKNLVSWNSIIAGYVQNGYANEALTIFLQMEMSGVKPDSITITSVLPACVPLAALQHGKEIHGHIIKNEFESDVFVCSALVDMYAKCGNIEIARRVFDRISSRDLVSWNAMIAGYAMHGRGEDALVSFQRMQRAGMRPDRITFIGVLCACSRSGLVDEGWQYFDSMTRDYRIMPEAQHYACMVDLLGRSGQVDEAENFIKKMPFGPGASVLGALLGACRTHGNIELGERVAERLIALEPENSGNYVLLSNIYAKNGRWDDVEKVRTMMKSRGVKKRPGYSWIEVNNEVHSFLVGDISHPQSDKIYALLESLTRQMEELGYVPETHFVLHDVEEQEKVNLLCSHSEKLAIVFGLINTHPGTSVRITKNLRVCGDCHIATKLISKIVRREIIGCWSTGTGVSGTEIEDSDNTSSTNIMASSSDISVYIVLLELATFSNPPLTNLRKLPLALALRNRCLSP